MLFAVLCIMAQAFPVYAHATAIAKTGKKQQQAITVTGKVVDDKGGPMPGVTVLEKGTSNGTVTDAKGVFKLNVTSAASVLVIRFIGYNDNEVTVGTQTSFNITLT